MVTRQGSLRARLVSACALALALAASAPSGVAASQDGPVFRDPPADGIALPTWRSRYVWSEDYGYSGWSSDVFDADSSAYEFAPGLGGVGSLWAWPTGDREYRPGGGEWVLRAPGTTRIARATVDLAYRTKVFAHLCVDAGLRSGAEGRDTHRDCKPPAPPAAEDDYVQAFSDPDAAPKATEAYVQLVMPPCNNPADTPCSKYIPPKDPDGNGPMVRAKAVSLVLVDDDLPVVTGSGAFYDLDGRYINGREVYPLTISASDAGAGIERISFDHVGHSTLADREAPCDRYHHTPEFGARICPASHEETLDIDTRPMPEGTQHFRMASADPAGNEGDHAFSVIIDRTPPPPPQGEFFSSEEGAVQARWDIAPDPVLIDGTPGSGTVGYRYRYNVEDLGWTDWVDAGPDARLTNELFDQGAGTLVDFQVVAVDAVGNVSEPATFSGAVPGEAPELTVTGSLRDLDGTYVNGGTADVTMSATDSGVGVSWIALEREGVGTVSQTMVPCPSQANGRLLCPPEYTHVATVDFGALSEGAHTFLASAGDRAGNVSDPDTWTVLVDRTAPSAPENIRLENPTPGDGEADLIWDDGDDPDLPDGISGSGATRSDWRVLRNGTWSDWSSTEEESVVLTHAVVGETLTAEVRSIDAVGNVSDPVSVDLTVPPAEVDTLSATRTASLAGPSFKNCTPLLKTARARDRSPDYRDFVEVQTELRGTLQVFCTKLSGVDRVEVSGRFAVEDANEDDGYRGIQIFQTKAFDSPEPYHAMPMGGIQADCDPFMGGRKRYLIVGDIKYVRPYAVDVTEGYNTDRNKPKRLRCPGFDERRDREVKGWLYLSRRAANRSDDSVRAPNVQLAKELNKPSVPKDVPRAWAAHHVIPATDRRARALQAYMFRCGVHPNEEANGIYLRDVGLKKTRNGRANPDWSKLAASHPDLAYRTYHGDTFGSSDPDRDYFTIIRSLMGGFDPERCPIGEPVLENLKDIKMRLANGNLGVQQDGH